MRLPARSSRLWRVKICWIRKLSVILLSQLCWVVQIPTSLRRHLRWSRRRKYTTLGKQILGNDPLGLHARPAGMLVKAVAGYASKVTITAPTGTADAKRLMAVMRLAAKQGMELTVSVDGADEEKAAAELQAFLAANL